MDAQDSQSNLMPEQAAPYDLLSNPPLWLIVVVLLLAGAATPLDPHLRALVGPAVVIHGDEVSPAGAWHNLVYRPIAAIEFAVIPLTLWSLLIIALPTAQRRWRGLGLVLAGFVLRGLFVALVANGLTWVRLLDQSLPVLLLLALLRQFPNGEKMWVAYIIPVALTQVLTHMLKVTVGRVRPDVAETQFEFHPLHRWVGDYSSFPSGHTSAATAMALLLSIYIPRFRWIFLSLAVVVGAQRIVSNAHWLSDVIGGAAIGLLAVWIGRRIFTPDHYRTQLSV
jgi:membrane-associated phospholipid phosphatase